VRFDVTTLPSQDILSAVENRQLQAGFVRGEYNTGLEKLLVSEDQIHVAAKGPIQLEDLPHLPQIEYTKEPTVIKATERWWKERFDQPPLIRMRVNHGDTCREMVLSGLGYGIFSDSKFTKGSQELTSTPLFFLDGSKFSRKTWFVYHKEELQRHVVREFVRFIEKLNFYEI
jgi:DNA-binding transcriptional LysR family regulator